MRAVLIGVTAILLMSLSAQGIAEERVLLNCRLMTEDTPWLFQQHCKSENFARLEVPRPDKLKKPKYNKKYAYKKDIYKKAHALTERQEKLYRKIHYLEKKLYAELRDCKNYKCKLIVKRKLARVYRYLAYNGISPSAPTSIGNSFGTPTNALSGTTSSLGTSVGNPVSDTSNTLGGVSQSGGGLVSGATDTVGGVLK